MNIAIFRTETIEKSASKEQLLEMLSCFEDADFNGYNGTEYNWEETTKGFYPSNQEYVLDVLRKSEETNKQTLIHKYFDMWLDRDCYYDLYKVNITETDTLLIVSVVAITD